MAVAWNICWGAILHAIKFFVSYGAICIYLGREKVSESSALLLLSCYLAQWVAFIKEHFSTVSK